MVNKRVTISHHPTGQYYLDGRYIVIRFLRFSQLSALCVDTIKSTYGGQLCGLEMANIDRLLDNDILSNESAEAFIDRWVQLCVQSVIERNKVNDIRILARLTKLFEGANKFPNASNLCYLTNLNLTETIAVIIKEDEKEK